MFGLGFTEILILGVLALILLGPEQLPDLARKLGKFINEMRNTTEGLKEEFRNSGLNPSNLLEDIRRDPMPPPQTPADVQPVNHAGDPPTEVTPEQLDLVAAVDEKNDSTGNDDSGKK